MRFLGASVGLWGSDILDASDFRAGKARYGADVNVLVHVNVNVPVMRVVLAEGMAWKARP
jgi:hypothetical protein